MTFLHALERMSCIRNALLTGYHVGIDVIVDVGDLQSILLVGAV